MAQQQSPTNVSPFLDRPVIADGRAALMRVIRERPTAADLDLARQLALPAPAPPQAATLPEHPTLPVLPELEP